MACSWYSASAVPRSRVTSPRTEPAGRLKLNALAGPMDGRPSRLKMIRSMAWASVAVPTVERALAPIRSWSTVIVAVRVSSESTSGRGGVAMNPWTNAEYVSLISRCDSAAIVLNTSELLPEPDTPVKTVSRRFGISTVTSLRLFTRAPRTRMRSWVSAACVNSRVLEQPEDVAVGVGDGGHQAAAAHVVRRLVDGGARGGHLGQLRLN